MLSWGHCSVSKSHASLLPSLWGWARFPPSCCAITTAIMFLFLNKRKFCLFLGSRVHVSQKKRWREYFRMWIPSDLPTKGSQWIFPAGPRWVAVCADLCHLFCLSLQNTQSPIHCTPNYSSSAGTYCVAVGATQSCVLSFGSRLALVKSLYL